MDVVIEVLRRQGKDLARKLKKDVYIVKLKCGSIDLVTTIRKEYKLIETITPQ